MININDGLPILCEGRYAGPTSVQVEDPSMNNWIEEKGTVALMMAAICVALLWVGTLVVLAEELL